MQASQFQWSSYENRVLGILFLTFGFVFFDRLALNFLFPKIANEFALTNKHLGLLASTLALSWALSGVFFGWLSDRIGARKPLLIGAVVVFSAASLFSGLAVGFITLLLCRLLMGLAEGPVLPLSQAILVAESSGSRLGLNMGLVQSSAPGLLGIVIGGPVIIFLAETVGWRWAFYISFVPGFLLAISIWRFIEEPKAEARQSRSAQIEEQSPNKGPDKEPNKEPNKVNFLSLLKHRNIVLSIVISCFFVTWFIVITTFTPVFLIDEKGFAPEQVSAVMVCIGIGHVFWGFAVPGLSDRIGRKTAMIVFSFLSVLAPVFMIVIHTAWLMSVLVGLSYAGLGCFVLFMSTIPAETVSRAQLATALGLVMGTGEIAGGFLGPSIAGYAADIYGLNAPMWISAGGALVAAVTSLFLIETAPIKTGKSAANSPRPMASTMAA